MKKILVLLLICALVFSLMIGFTSCRPKEEDKDDDIVQDGETDKPGGDNPGGNNPGGNNPGVDPEDTTVVPGDDPIKDGTIETPPIPAGSTDNRGQ